MATTGDGGDPRPRTPFPVAPSHSSMRVFLYEATLRNIVRRPRAFPSDCGPADAAVRYLISRLLIKDSADRFRSRRGAAGVKAHPFFRSLDFAAGVKAHPYLGASISPPVVAATRRPRRAPHLSQSCKEAAPKPEARFDLF